MLCIWRATVAAREAAVLLSVRHPSVAIERKLECLAQYLAYECAGLGLVPASQTGVSTRRHGLGVHEGY